MKDERKKEWSGSRGFFFLFSLFFILVIYFDWRHLNKDEIEKNKEKGI